ncbi:MAG TPA: RsiV family protein [Candidatus Eisenbacteria bacterium]|nr:RsiV family protein [Candidatus Eisenbacteria bacterium]
MTGRARVVIAAALVAAIAGCTPKAEPVAPPAERLRFTRQHATKTYGDCTGGSDKCTRISLRWPQVAAAPTVAARESITAFVRGTLNRPYDGGAPFSSEDSVMTEFITGYREFASRFPDGPATGWTFERRIEPLGDTLGVAGIAVTEQSYLGGAHPNSTTLFTNFDLATGRSVRLEDLFRAGARDSLDALGERAFRRVRKLPEAADLAAAGFQFEGGRFRLNDNVAVTPTGLLCFFNDYEVGPHTLGATQFSLPWADVMPFARPDGPLQR